MAEDQAMLTGMTIEEMEAQSPTPEGYKYVQFDGQVVLVKVDSPAYKAFTKMVGGVTQELAEKAVEEINKTLILAVEGEVSSDSELTEGNTFIYDFDEGEGRLVDSRRVTVKAYIRGKNKKSE